MFLKSLLLTNFRNIASLEIDFPATALFLGENAQGKSNILESICFLATTKSIRAEKDVELIKSGENVLRAAGKVLDDRDLGQERTAKTKEKELEKESGEEGIKLEIALQLNPNLTNGSKTESLEKKIKVNGVPKKALDYIGNLAVVSFAPEDINLVTGPPALRRWYMDVSLALIDREYKQAISQYSGVLASRNRVLKNIKAGIAKVFELDFWSEQMIKIGALVFRQREKLFQSLNDSGEQTLGNFKFIYQPNLLSEARLREVFQQEIEAGMSLIGPHRDDFYFERNGKDLSHCGSRGEQRTAVLELKIRELAIVKSLKSTAPILLLDDVFSELDPKHRDYVAERVFEQQTIISAVIGENIPQRLFNQAKIFKVTSGAVQ